MGQFCKLLKFVESQDSVTIQQVADELGISYQTARRRLNAMAEYCVVACYLVPGRRSIKHVYKRVRR